MGFGAKIFGLGTSGGMVALMGIPEIGKISAASKKGHTAKQIFGSVINVGKWSAIPAAIALFNPVGVAACAAAGIAGFVLPDLIPDLDFSGEKSEKQKLDYKS